MNLTVSVLYQAIKTHFELVSQKQSIMLSINTLMQKY